MARSTSAQWLQSFSRRLHLRRRDSRGQGDAVWRDCVEKGLYGADLYTDLDDHGLPRSHTGLKSSADILEEG